MNEPPPERMPVAEERQYHVMAEDLPLATVARIEAHPEFYPARRSSSAGGGRIRADGWRRTSWGTSGRTRKRG